MSDPHLWNLPLEALASLDFRGARPLDRAAWGRVSEVVSAASRGPPAIDAENTTSTGARPLPDDRAARRSLPVLCPSATMRPGAFLLGIVGADGELRLAPERLEIDARFVRTAEEGRPHESRFRFAAPCVTRGCSFWGRGRCELGDALADHGPSAAESAPQACSIRDDCRWFQQRGEAVCRLCPGVIPSMFSGPFR